MAGFYRLFSEKFSYYNEPEGKDPLGKIFGLAKYGWVNSTFLTIYDSCLISRCQNAAQFMNTAGYWFIPITGMCFSYSSVTYALTHLRNKDDVWNNIAGALSAGGVLHAWQKSPVISGWATFFFVIYVVLRKDYELHRDKSKPRNFIISEERPIPYHLPLRYMNFRETFGPARFKPNKDYYANFNVISN